MMYTLHSELFFNLDEGGRRGHEKIVQKRFRLDVRKYVLVTVLLIDGIMQLPEKCIKCNTVNTFKKHISIELEPESYSML